MERMIAYCGLICDTCPIHLATLEPELSKKKAMKEEIAGLYAAHYGAILSAAEKTRTTGVFHAP